MTNNTQCDSWHNTQTTICTTKTYVLHILLISLEPLVTSSTSIVWVEFSFKRKQGIKTAPNKQWTEESGKKHQFWSCKISFWSLNLVNHTIFGYELHGMCNVWVIKTWTKRSSVLWLSYRFFEEFLFHIANLSCQKL